MEYHHDTEYCEVFCLRHRPFPLLKEIQRNEKLVEDEIVHFSSLFDNSLYEYRNLKRWTDRDKRELFAHVQRVFFQMRKLKITLYKLPPSDEPSYYVKGGRYFAEPRDWTVTLSREEFPWPECRFKNYTSRDCHSLFIEVIRTEDSFIKKVVTDKYMAKYD